MLVTLLCLHRVSACLSIRWFGRKRMSYESRRLVQPYQSSVSAFEGELGAVDSGAGEKPNREDQESEEALALLSALPRRNSTAAEFGSGLLS